MNSDFRDELKNTMDSLKANIISNQIECERLNHLDEETASMEHAYFAIVELLQVEPDPKIQKELDKLDKLVRGKNANT